MAEVKKDAAEQKRALDWIMAKALRTQEPVAFMGQDIILKALSYADDMIVQSIVQDVYNEAAASGLEGPMLDRLILTAQVLATVKMAAYAKDGAPLYRTMEDLNAALKLPDVFKAVNDLFVKYMELLTLTMAEKKSS